MSGKLISEAAEAVILTLYSGKVMEGVGLARENQVSNPRLPRAHTKGSWCGPTALTQTSYAGADLGITGIQVDHPVHYSGAAALGWEVVGREAGTVGGASTPLQQISHTGVDLVK